MRDRHFGFCEITFVVTVEAELYAYEKIRL